MSLRTRASALARRAVELTPLPQPPWRPTRHPVVLMHGFGALANLLQDGVLHAEAMHLRGRGVAAWAPHVDPYGTLATRAAAWAARFQHVLDATGAEKLNLVAFSSAGLDARLLARDAAWAGRLASLVTVSTPHRGTALASWVLSHADDALGRLAFGVMDGAGRAAWETAPPESAAALAELTPETVAAAFPTDELVDGCWCASYSSRAGAGTPVSMYPPLVVTNRILHRLAGVNDGIVPTASMAWGDSLERLDADHARQIGMALTLSRHYSSLAFFEAHAERLRARGL